ncbi:MAG: formate dehydrogenase, partial [Chloroflexi bacterium]|nr:formate dehydrogenase [Chloroflexota bacterium]
FLKLSGATAGSVLLPTGFAVAAGKIQTFPLHKPVKEAATICPYCSCGCGLLIATGPDGHIINCEGDPDNPQNRGALDPKSVAVRQLSQSQLRLKKPLYRAPGSDKFEEKTWEWTIAEVSKRIKATRDTTFQQTNDKGVTVNRTPGIAFLGGAANNDEECYLATKLSRALGIVYLEHQARI